MRWDLVDREMLKIAIGAITPTAPTKPIGERPGSIRQPNPPNQPGLNAPTPHVNRNPDVAAQKFQQAPVKPPKPQIPKSPEKGLRTKAPRTSEVAKATNSNLGKVGTVKLSEGVFSRIWKGLKSIKYNKAGEPRKAWRYGWPTVAAAGGLYVGKKSLDAQRRWEELEQAGLLESDRYGGTFPRQE